MLSVLRKGKSAEEALLEIWEEDQENFTETNDDDRFAEEIIENAIRNDVASNGHDYRQTRPEKLTSNVYLQNQLQSFPMTKADQHSCSTSSSLSGLTCPVCLDSYDQLLTKSGLRSTICGHIFCQICIARSMEKCKRCPSCRKKLKDDDIHPIYLSIS